MLLYDRLGLKKLWPMQTSDNIIILHNNYYLLYSLIANTQVLNTFLHLPLLFVLIYLLGVLLFLFFF